ncbi:hypothetical protein [Streptomyces sp. NPDC097610]|uniref:hypothetical protein n=1 Tax=Streptomyces sp. NPDC097610 TaxID=3157227 RepID=UPI003327975C
MTASGNLYSAVYQAAGDINLHQRPTLPAFPVPDGEIKAVRRAWVKVSPADTPLTTADQVHTLLAKHEPIVVIHGPRGTGKTAAALRALTGFVPPRLVPDAAQGRLQLRHVLPDWDTPESDLLPREPGCGYILDLSGERWSDPPAAARQLLAHTDALQRAGSCLIVITSEDGWPGGHDPQMGRIAVPAEAPRGDLVLERHLQVLHPDPDKSDWLTSPQRLADLLRPDMPPAEAAGLAIALSRIDATRPDALDKAREAMTGWQHLVAATFAATEGNADDRALLLAAVMLDGHSQTDVLKAARALLQQTESRSITDVLTAPALAVRLEKVQAKVESQQVSFDHLPGYPDAVLRYVWRQLSDAQPLLLEWIQRVTAPRGLALPRIDAIAELLAGLAAAENDLRPIDITQAWAQNRATQQAAATLLATAAQHPTLGSDVRGRLRTWASNPPEGAATVAAVACQGAFASLYPRQALTCLRWILDRPHNDQAVTEAAQALRTMAGNLHLLPEVWEAVTAWRNSPATGDRGYRAARRAFIALLTPQSEPSPAPLLLANALTDAATADDLAAGWCAVLEDSAFDEQAESLLTNWAQAVADAVLDKDAVSHILNRVIDQHLMTGPMAAFLMGREGPVHTSAAVIDLRKHLMISYRKGAATLPPAGPHEASASDAPAPPRPEPRTTPSGGSRPQDALILRPGEHTAETASLHDAGRESA